MIGRQEGAFTPFSRLRKEKSFREHQKGSPRGTQKESPRGIQRNTELPWVDACYIGNNSDTIGNDGADRIGSGADRIGSGADTPKPVGINPNGKPKKPHYPTSVDECNGGSQSSSWPPFNEESFFKRFTSRRPSFEGPTNRGDSTQSFENSKSGGHALFKARQNLALGLDNLALGLDKFG